MKVIVNQSDSVLKVVFSKGFDENNKEVLKTKTLPDLRTSASNEAFYEAAKFMHSMQKHDMKKVTRHEVYELLEDKE